MLVAWCAYLGWLNMNVAEYSCHALDCGIYVIITFKQVTLSSAVVDYELNTCSLIYCIREMVHCYGKAQ